MSLSLMPASIETTPAQPAAPKSSSAARWVRPALSLLLPPALPVVWELPVGLGCWTGGLSRPPPVISNPFVDLALGIEGHNRRHLVPLAAARKRILSYMEAGDLMAIDAAIKGGFPILRRIAKNAAEHDVEHRVVFGFSYQSAGQLVEFLKVHRHDLRQVTGVRYSGELGHPFHVVDDETVVLPLDHPFIKEGRFASLLVRDRELADSLAEGFHELWRKAMKSLREIQVDPRGHRS